MAVFAAQLMIFWFRESRDNSFSRTAALAVNLRTELTLKYLLHLFAATRTKIGYDLFGLFEFAERSIGGIDICDCETMVPDGMYSRSLS